ncbi:uncharacterized protein LACBIDRAFT_300532 [Laccaria bicolor S238N-H82]|uniref:Predicted protein n=1 Tax=Laccaria bicolor (strain S238N-H82 / ATCC MYA-4686) TaxID=486041 RepID=B0DGZ4_LACBS|nr:uncharacterized protein LACBIDRAFT_300532 [Laccaria bicolor S238N-H82]EDR06237.1 predicted protein [Laccaria bicolor S238N-H82]|eukprot:XP_001883098.1 predicted protein [Laccaria bicolor S238N-H82]
MAELTISPPSDYFGHHPSPSTTNVRNYHDQSQHLHNNTISHSNLHHPSPRTTNVENYHDESQHSHTHHYVNSQSFAGETVFGTTIINEQHSSGHPALSDDVARLFNDTVVDCAITANLEVPLAPQGQAGDGANPAADTSDIVLDELQDPTFTRTPEQSYVYVGQLKKIILKMKEGKHILTEDDLNDLNTSLFGSNAASRGILGYDRDYVRWKLRDGSQAPIVADFLEQMRRLSQFVQGMGGGETIAQLVNALRLSETGDDTVKRLQAWRLLWLSLLFDHSMVIGSQSLKTQIHSFFGLPCPGFQRSFNITLKHLVEVDIEVIPTENIREHFQLDGKKLKVLRLSPVDAISLASYNNNLIARAFGVETLGSEILHSLYVLYGRDRYRMEAEALGLGPNWTWNEVIRREDFLRNRECQPQVLMRRVYSLEKLIRYRRSWLPSLIRDVRKSKRQQPFVFWGSVLAILYGTSSILQTLASFWSVVLVYKPPSHPS